MQKLESKISWLPALINFSILIAFTGYMIFLWKLYPFSMGGSQTLFSIIAVLMCISIVKKEIALECSMFSLVLFIIMAINFFAALEYHVHYSISIEIVVGILIVMMSFLVLQMTSNPMNDEKKEVLSAEKKDLKRRISFLLFHAAWITAIYTVATFASLGGARENRMIGKECSLYFTYFSLSGLIIGLIFTLLLMKRWSFLDGYIASLVQRKIQINIAPVKRWFLPIAISIFLLGIPLEMPRGFLLLWFLSWLSCVLISIMLFKVWKFVFEQVPLHAATDLDLENVKQLPSDADLKYVITFVIINVPVGLFYIIVLLLFEKNFCK